VSSSTSRSASQSLRYWNPSNVLFHSTRCGWSFGHSRAPFDIYAVNTTGTGPDSNFISVTIA
jgi:hypothetical protein